MCKDAFLKGYKEIVEATSGNTGIALSFYANKFNIKPTIFMPKSYSIERQKLLKDIATTSWGESFIADNLKFIFEAMLGDPIYGSNKDESGWRWLEHKAGLPRPKVAYL